MTRVSVISRRCFFLSLGASLSAFAPAARSAGAPPGDISRRPIVYSVPGMAGVRVREGITYKTVGNSALEFDMYSPAIASRATPAVILVHGGPVSGPAIRSTGFFSSYGRLLAASGMTGIAFDHRFTGVDRLPDSAADLADLVGYVRRQASGLGVDQDSLALWSFSAGAQLTAAVLRERQAWWKMIVAYYGTMEPLTGKPDARMSAIAALGQDASNAPPIILARAGRDDPSINATIDRFSARAISAGATVDLLLHPTGRHNFDLLDADERSRQIIRRTLAALRGSFGMESP